MNRWTSVLLAFGGLIAFPLVDSAIKGTLILVLAGGVCVWLRRDSAATRHFVWTIAIGLLVAMPVLSLVLPQWRILPGWMNSQPVTLQQISLPTVMNEATLVEADITDEPAQPIAFERLPVDISGDASDAFNVPVPLTDHSPADAVSAIGPVEEAATTLPAWISVTWLIGCALLLVRLSIAAMMLRRSERRCVVVQRSHHAPHDERRSESPKSIFHPLASGMRQLPGPARMASSVSDTEVVEYRPVDTGRSPEELGIALEQSKLALGLKRPVAVLLDPKRSIPIVWGLWKTRLQLPKEALQWSEEQLQSVLLHELAHVRRRDLFVLALTQIACALHWFNPLVWIAAWRMHLERERACDDLVLNTGIRASSYAEHLLNVATRLTSSQWTQACGLAMARNSSLHRRLSAVLSEKQNRRSVTVAMTIMTLFCSLLVGIPVSMLRGADEAVQETPASQLIGETKPEGTTAEGRRVEASSGRTEHATVDAADDVVTVTWDHIDLHKILHVESLPADLPNVLPGSVKQLDGKRVRLRGYMYPTFEATGLTKFVISRDNTAMMLSHSPLLDQIVNVHLSADTDTDYIEGRPFDVEGIFQVKPAYDANQKLSGLYRLEDAQIDVSLPGKKTANSNRADSSPSGRQGIAAAETAPFAGDAVVTRVNGKPITVDELAAKTPGTAAGEQGNLRIATHPGLFEVGNRVFLWVARKLHPDPDENVASLVRVSKEGKQISTDIPIPPGEGTWAAGWVRGGQVLWVAQKGKITRYDFSDAEQVQITDETQSSTDAAVPKKLNALMQQAIGEDSSKTDASQNASQGHGTEPASPDEPRASLDPIENPSRRTITWEDLAINATTLADIRDEEMALDEVSEDLKTLNGKRVVLRGYMYPTFEATGLKEFVLVSDLYAASFVRKASIDALVGVRLHGKSVTDFVEAREISVEGILRIDPRLEKDQERSQLVHLYRLEDAQILQLHERTSVLKKGILVRQVSAEKSQDAALEYRAAFEHGEYDLGRGRTLRIRAIDRQQQSIAIEWPSDDPSQVYSWSMIPEAPHRADSRMTPEKPWGQTTGWGVVWHTESDTVWIADGTQRTKLNVAEPTAIAISDSEYDASIERVFREHLGLLAWHPGPNEQKQITLLWPKGALAKVKEGQEDGKRSADVRVEAAKMKNIRN